MKAENLSTMIAWHKVLASPDGRLLARSATSTTETASVWSTVGRRPRRRLAGSVLSEPMHPIR